MYARLGKILVYLLNGKVDMWEGKPRRVDKINMYINVYTVPTRS